MVFVSSSAEGPTRISASKRRPDIPEEIRFSFSVHRSPFIVLRSFVHYNGGIVRFASKKSLMPSATAKRDSLVLLFAMILPCVMAWLYFVVLADVDGGANRALPIAFGLGKAVQALLPIAYVAWFERDRLQPHRPAAQGLALGALFGVIVAASILALYGLWLKHSLLLGNTPRQVLAKVREFGVATPNGFLAMGLFIGLLHSLFEEYYWRWFVFGTLRRHVRVATAIMLSGLGFTLHHVVILGVYFPGRFWSLAMPFSLCVGVGGGVWAWIYHRSGSLYAAWLSHALIDAAIMLVGFDMVAPYLGINPQEG